MVQFKNFTPHDIVLNNGVKYASVGLARVSSSFSSFDEDGICEQTFGEVEGLPEPEEGVLLIVSSIVKAASNRKDLVVPATGHKDCKRSEKGFIISVPGFCK